MGINQTWVEQKSRVRRISLLIPKEMEKWQSQDKEPGCGNGRTKKGIERKAV
ncbi:unnamed protein product [Citrullus colocynthis]|uniref:Uncharacterized protein n=1 Tax=Citrullus colocynthis TaxID=252529 RepID=A0ABP0Y7D3_9ROSI